MRGAAGAAPMRMTWPMCPSIEGGGSRPRLSPSVTMMPSTETGSPGCSTRGVASMRQRRSRLASPSIHVSASSGAATRRLSCPTISIHIFLDGHWISG
jgi:hypothetical protein